MVSHPLTPTTSLPDPARLEAELRQSKRIIPVLKEALATAHAALAERFFAGASVNDLIHERATFIDQILRIAWRRFEWNERLTNWRKTRISLLAVGGYGRAELFPHSDIDLLILLERASYGLHEENIQNFLTLLWDIGLEVGHSVRSVRECKLQAKSDITIMTALMETRTIAGSDEIRQALRAGLEPARMWSQRKFYNAKLEELAERDEKYDDTLYHLEPNVKSSPGGLRDIHIVMWLAKRYFGTDDRHVLSEQDFMSTDERDLLEASRDFLWKIRYGLHVLSGRADDRLSFESQRKLSDLFGYRDRDEMLAVEQFMRDYYRTALNLRGLTDLLLQHLDEHFLRRRERLVITPINERFRIKNNRIEATSVDLFTQSPSALLELFVLMGKMEQIEGIRSSTIKLVRSHVDLIDDDFRNDPVNTALFLDLLRAPHKLSFHLRSMKRLGILGAYLPEVERIIGQMQFDLFHIYTVDEHTMQVIRNLRLFRYKNNEQRFPVAAHIITRLPKLELLYIAALYHDIGKGTGMDHSDVGARLAEAFCERHRMGKWDSNLVCWLVQNHLVMSITAQKQDITDPDVVRDFALFVQDQVRLDYLYTLTVADITATNPNLWNSWKASLLRQLYLDTKRMLRRGLENYVDKSEYIAETQQAAIDRLAEKGLAEAQVLALWEGIGDEYFIRESVSDIVWHGEAICNHHQDDEPLVLIKDRFYEQGEEGATQLFIHTQDRPHLFAAIVNALDQLGLDVQEARILTSASNLVFNTFIVLEVDGQPVGENRERISKIHSILLQHLRHPERYSKLIRHRTSPALRQFDIKTEVTIKCDVANQQTVLEVDTQDRPGLLALVGRIFGQFDVSLQNAKITTLGERVEDLFYISDKNGEAISDPDLCRKLEETLTFELDHHANI